MSQVRRTADVSTNFYNFRHMSSAEIQKSAAGITFQIPRFCCCSYAVGGTTRRHPATIAVVSSFHCICSRHVHVIACPPPNAASAGGGRRKFCFQLQGASPPDPPPGALPLDLAGGTAPDPPYRLALPRSLSSPSRNEILRTPLRQTPIGAPSWTPIRDFRPPDSLPVPVPLPN